MQTAACGGGSFPQRNLGSRNLTAVLSPSKILTMLEHHPKQGDESKGMEITTQRPISFRATIGCTNETRGDTTLPQN